MKQKVFFTLVLFLFAFLACRPYFLPRSPTARAAGASFALIKENAVLLDANKTALTGLPASYFVEVVSADGDYYAVKYGGLSGFMYKDHIEAVDYEPITKYATAYFTADNDTHSVLVRAAPKKDGEVISQMDDGDRAVLYGGLTGDALTTAGSLWYYVSYAGIAGYVYSAQGQADNIPYNITGRVEPPAPEDTGGGWKSMNTVIILGLSLPAVIIMFALFSRPSAKNSSKT